MPRGRHVYININKSTLPRCALFVGIDTNFASNQECLGAGNLFGISPLTCVASPFAFEFKSAAETDRQTDSRTVSMAISDLRARVLQSPRLLCLWILSIKLQPNRKLFVLSFSHWIEKWQQPKLSSGRRMIVRKSNSPAIVLAPLIDLLKASHVRNGMDSQPAPHVHSTDCFCNPHRYTDDECVEWNSIRFIREVKIRDEDKYFSKFPMYKYFHFV